jgi:uncharacterized Fe-S cluster protein YjdI
MVMTDPKGSEERHGPGVARAYEGDGITVYWEPALCIHTTNCIRNQPEVFDPGARPWVRVGAATAAEVARAVESCPTGALSYVRTAAEDGERPADPATVQPRRNGPLFVRGNLQVVDMEGRVVREATRMALCRCGQSANKPFCDLSHRAAGFQG